MVLVRSHNGALDGFLWIEADSKTYRLKGDINFDGNYEMEALLPNGKVAGLLQGKRATTHWAFTDLLPLVGATPEKARVVRDGNVFTAGGVTSGIDFALTIVGEIYGADLAKTIQLGIEYDPAPPFASGHPDRADPAAVTSLKTRYAAAHNLHRDRLEHVRQRGGLS